MHIDENQLKEFLLETGLVTKARFKKVIEQSKKDGTSIGDALLATHVLTDTELRKSYAYIMGLSFVDLTKYHISYDVLSLIPEPVARRYNIVAYNLNTDDNTLEVAMIDTDSLSAIDFLQTETGLKVLPRITDEVSIRNTLKQYHKALEHDLTEVIRYDAEQIASFIENDSSADIAEGLQILLEQESTTRLVDALLQHALIQRATDVHIEPHFNGLFIRYRIDGVLHDILELTRESGLAIVTRLKELAGIDLLKTQLPQEGRFRMESGGERMMLHVSVIQINYGEKAVVHMFKEGGGDFTLEKIGFEERSMEAVYRSLRTRSGLILLTGPSGSGRTTTLYSLLDILNTPDVNISTIEDPIEYQLPRVNQMQVDGDMGLTYNEGLKALLRQDPDVIVLGEVSDANVAILAVNAALTGHLVIATMSSETASDAIVRMRNFGVEPFLLASVLRAVVSQRLVRTLCEDRDVYTLSSDEIREIERHMNVKDVLKTLKANGSVKKSTTWKTMQFARPVSSEQCDTGYKGRKAIVEVLPIDGSVKELLLSGATSLEIEDEARRRGMFTMLEDGIMKAASGITSIEEVLRVITE